MGMVARAREREREQSKAKPFIICAGTKGSCGGDKYRGAQTEWERWTEGRIEPVVGRCGDAGVFLSCSRRGPALQTPACCLCFDEAALAVNQSKDTQAGRGRHPTYAAGKPDGNDTRERGDFGVRMGTEWSVLLLTQIFFRMRERQRI